MAPRSFFATLLAALVLSVQAAPSALKRQSITALSASQISAFRPFAHFASTAYCQPSATLAWSCGANCDANPGFIPTASGGDDADTQYWYVGFSPAQNTVIVAHQGTDPSSILADLTDADFFLTNLDSGLFPGLSSSIQVHNGFAGSHARSAPAILAAVKSTISAHSASSVTIVGHSLGAALALLDSVYLPLHVSGVSFKTVGFGMPRVGNQAWADYVDAHAKVTHISNKEDPVPILPGRFLGFHHPSGEVHITDANVWESCPGQDNTSTQCTVGDVPTIFQSDLNNHNGPYDTVEMGC